MRGIIFRMAAFVGVLKKIWRIIRWPILAFVLLYVGLVLYYAVEIPKQDAIVLQKIQSQKLDMRDIDGSNLPPVPDPKLIDATVEGIDANGNGIRDDVELAIFKKYPNDAKTRAAALQYAMTEQVFLSGKIQTKELWKAAAEQSSRAFDCMLGVTKKNALAISEEIQGMVYNSDARNRAKDDAFKYITSYGSADGNSCDIQ